MSDDESGNPIATITNQCDVDVDIYDVFNASGGDDGALTYTKLGSIKKGETQKLQTIHLASQLQAMYTGTVAALNNASYCQFPCAVMSILSIGSAKKTSHTITANEQRGMEQAFLLQQYVVANPDSKTARQFTAALKDADQESTVAAFFAASASFKACSLSAWTAVAAWTSQFTSPWQGTYYLYSAPPAPPDGDGSKGSGSSTDAGGGDASKGNASKDGGGSSGGAGANDGNGGSIAASAAMTNGPALLGAAATVGGSPPGANGAFETKLIATLTIDAADANTGKLTLSGASTVATVTMSGGELQESQIGSGASVSLKPAWIYSEDGGGTSGKECGGMSGTINGTTVFGTHEQRTPADATTPEDKERDEREFDRSFSEITTIISLGIGVLTAYFFYKQLQTGQTAKSDSAAEQAAKAGTSVDEARAREAAAYKTRLREVPRRVVEALDRGASEMGPAMRRLGGSRSASVLQRMLEEQIDRLNEVMGERAPTAALEETARSLSSIRDDLMHNRIDQARRTLDATRTSIEKVVQTTRRQYERGTLSHTGEAIERGSAASRTFEERGAERSRTVERSPEDFDIGHWEVRDVDVHFR